VDCLFSSTELEKYSYLFLVRETLDVAIHYVMVSVLVYKHINHTGLEESIS
jgi:hypothetical protein